MVPGFHKRQNNILHNTKDVENQEHAALEASTIDTLDGGKNSEMGNNVDKATESNAFLSNVHNTSDIADFCASTSAQNDIHNSSLLPTKTMFPSNCTHNEMLSHYNHILIGCFKDIFQTVDTNNLSAVLQALKELNFVLTNRALNYQLTMVYHWNLNKSLLKRYLILLVCALTGPQPTPLSIAIEGDQGPGNQHYRYARQSSPVPRYNQQTSRLDTHAYSHKNRFYHQPSYNNRSRCHSHSPFNHLHNAASNSYDNVTLCKMASNANIITLHFYTYVMLKCYMHVIL